MCSFAVFSPFLAFSLFVWSLKAKKSEITVAWCRQATICIYCFGSWETKICCREQYRVLEIFSTLTIHNENGAKPHNHVPL